MVSGVSIASKSSTLADGVADSRDDWISSALAWASVTFCSASSINRLRTTYTRAVNRHPTTPSGASYLDGADIGVLGDILVLIKAIFGSLPFAQIHTELNEK